MWRLGRLLVRKTGTCMRQAKAHYQNYVMNETLAQLTKHCYTECPVPRFPPQKVAVVGAGTDVGRVVCLMLKQQSVVKILSMFDSDPNNDVVGVATDIAHIDTSTCVEVYQGRHLISKALDNADLVLIVGGCLPEPPYCCMWDHDVFYMNAQHVHFAVLAAAHFCPYAVIAIQTPPVDSHFALAKYTLKKYLVYDHRKLLGINAISSMRANQLFGDALGNDPEDSYVPIICGCCKCTRVPLFSATTNYWCLKQEDKEFIMRIIREGDELICKVKSNYQHAHLSTGFATARFGLSVMKGLFEKPTFIDSALVEQPDPSRTFNQKIFASPVTIGKQGISKVEVPKKLDDFENHLVSKSIVDLEDLTNLGKCYARGDIYKIHSGKFYYPFCCDPCPFCEPSKS